MILVQKALARTIIKRTITAEHTEDFGFHACRKKEIAWRRDRMPEVLFREKTCEPIDLPLFNIFVGGISGHGKRSERCID